MPRFEIERTTLDSEQRCHAAWASARSAIPWIVILVVWMAAYFQGAFRPSLLDDAATTHAEAAREMYQAVDYVTLHVTGIRYLEKAPFPYWQLSIGFTIFGGSEFAVRLPVILSILLLIGLGALWGLRAFGDRGGIYSGLFIATC